MVSDETIREINSYIESGRDDSPLLEFVRTMMDADIRHKPGKYKIVMGERAVSDLRTSVASHPATKYSQPGAEPKPKFDDPNYVGMLYGVDVWLDPSADGNYREAVPV